MKTILDTIVEHKRMEVLKRKARKSPDELRKKPFYSRTPLDPLSTFDSEGVNIIAEFKRKSPSKGLISRAIDPLPVVTSYREAGAAASSILTDRDFFGGSFRDLENVRSGIGEFPLLRKDFLIDPYQVLESKAYGADIILLIAAILDKKKIREMTDIARGLGLTVLLEVHSEEEIEKWNPGISLVGVNNRDLKSFHVSVDRSRELFPKLPAETIRISESGLNDASVIKSLFDLGFRGFLMGEHFMKNQDPGLSLATFFENLKN